ncbi:MAG: tetratricopeptide repeat protein [Polyangiales bacterium]
MRPRTQGPGICRLAIVALLVLATGPLFGSAAYAQEEPSQPPPEALEFFQAGREHYSAGRYAEAAAAMEQAIALDPNSETLVFNLARIYELLGELDKAIEYGRRFRDMVAYDPTEVERADATLRRLDGAREWLALRQAEQAPELRQMAPREIVRERGVVDTAFWAVLASGAGLLAAGGILGGVALSKNNSANSIVSANVFDQEERIDLRSQADGLALTADITLIAGGATCVAALLLYLLRVRTYEREAVDTEVAATVNIEAGPGAAALSVGGAF